MFTSKNFYTQNKEFKLLNPKSFLKNGQFLNTINIFQQSQDFTKQMKRQNNELNIVDKKIKLEKKVTLLFRRRSSKDAKSFEIIPLTVKEKKNDYTHLKTNTSTLFEFPKLIMNDLTSGAMKFHKRINFVQSSCNNDDKTPKENLPITEEIKEKIKKKILDSRNSPCIIIYNNFGSKQNKSCKNEHKRNDLQKESVFNNQKDELKNEITKTEQTTEIRDQLKNEDNGESKKELLKSELEKRNDLEKKGYKLKKKNVSLHLRNISLNINTKFEEKTKFDENFIKSVKEIEIQPWKIENTQEDEIFK